MLRTILAAAAAVTTVLACPDHVYNSTSLGKRQTVVEATDWAYEASYNWGTIREEYRLCQTGTQQSPIPLLITQGLSLNHVPTFDYSDSVEGDFFNWGYGPSFSIYHEEGDFTTLPHAMFDDEVVYMTGWHVHAPADHTVQGDRSKAELHLVHVDEAGNPRAVFAIRIDPGNADSQFFGQLPEIPSLTDHETRIPTTLNIRAALDEVNHFNEFWTYRGSLTSPPCREGLRWFVARNILFVSNEQMVTLLSEAKFSARAEQEVWLHQINV